MESKEIFSCADVQEFATKLQLAVATSLQEEAKNCLFTLGIDFTEETTVDAQMKLANIEIRSEGNRLLIYKNGSLEYSIGMVSETREGVIYCHLETEIESNVEIVS